MLTLTTPAGIYAMSYVDIGILWMAAFILASAVTAVGTAK
jgi:hypothetical protein